ncbi:MAG: hypothetical protein V2I66_17045 [Halieaceae bacterium]|jgi:hypothetical protein|nr:hypothetical protein [Halieaceae bacterium]
MHELVLRINKPELCYVFADNATKRGHEDLARQAYRRAVDLRAAEHDDVSEDERLALKAFYAYEEALSWGQRKRKRATGTWQMVSRIGILPTLQKRLAGKQAEEARETLKDLAMDDYSFDAIARQIGLNLEEAA